MSRWLLDLGNSRLKTAVLGDDGLPGPLQAIEHADWQADAERLPRGEVAYLASVAGATQTLGLLEALSTRFRRIERVRTQAQLAGLQIAYAEPAQLGVDRFLGMLGAIAVRPDACRLVVGVGTALTVDLVDADGRHHGGAIAPSPTLMRQALHDRVPHLPGTGGQQVGFAETTLDALASGCDGAAIGLVERAQRLSRWVCGRPADILLHGGGADALLPHLDAAAVHPELVLRGVATWATVGARA